MPPNVRALPPSAFTCSGHPAKMARTGKELMSAGA